MKLKLSIIILTALFIGGCTKSLVATYEPGVELENNNIKDIKLAIYQFKDQRAWIDTQEDKSNSFIGKQSPWKFGLEYEGTEFQSVSIVLQDVFIKDFKSVGVAAFKGENSSASSYSLKGKILNFEFENEAGVWTVTSRRHVSLALTLTDKEGNTLLSNALFNEINRENEGIGVLHSTNVDKLMKVALKKVVKSVITRTNIELALMGIKTMSVTVNDIDITPYIITNNYAGFTTTRHLP